MDINNLIKKEEVIMDEKFRNFKEKIEIMFEGCCLSCLNDGYMGSGYMRYQRFLRQCFEEIGFYPEVVNPVIEKLFPQAGKKIVFFHGGAYPTWCHGSHHEFLIEFEKVYEEVRKNPPVILKEENTNCSMFSVLTPDEVKNKVKKLEIKEGLTMTVERKKERNKNLLYVTWIIFSSISPSGVIKGYKIEREEEYIEYEDVKHMGGRSMIFIDPYDGSIIDIYNFLRPFAGPAY